MSYFDNDGICVVCGGAGNVWNIKDEWWSTKCPNCKGLGEKGVNA